MKIELQIKKDKGELHALIIDENNPKWENEQNLALVKLAKRLKLKGFREGMVPIEVARKTVDRNSIYQEAIEHHINNNLLPLVNKEIKPEMEVIASPTFFINSLDEKKVDIKLIYPIYPVIQLGDYKHITASYAPSIATDEEVNQQIEAMAARDAMWKVVPRPVAMGDRAIFDFEGFIEGKPFPGGKASRYELEIGSKTFIAGFEEQMLGMKAEDMREIKVTFPKEYQSDLLKGKEAIFKLKLWEVRTREVPKVDDEFAKRLNIKGVTDANKLRMYIASNLDVTRINIARDAFQRQAFKEIAKSMSASISPLLIEREFQNQIRALQEDLKRRKTDLKSHLKQRNITEQQLADDLRNAAKNILNDTLIFSEIARLEKLEEIKDEDIEAFYKNLSAKHWVDEKTIHGLITQERARSQIINERVINKLLEFAEVAKASTVKEKSTKPEKETKPSSGKDAKDTKEVKDDKQTSSAGRNK